MTFAEIETAVTDAVATLRAAHPSTSLRVARSSCGGLEIRSTTWAPVSVSARATPEQVEDALRTVRGLCAKLTVRRPVAATAPASPRVSAARRFDRLYNEGGEGFNPHR
jgi:hypothetical protein